MDEKRLHVFLESMQMFCCSGGKWWRWRWWWWSGRVDTFLFYFILFFQSNSVDVCNSAKNASIELKKKKKKTGKLKSCLMGCTICTKAAQPSDKISQTNLWIYLQR